MDRPKVQYNIQAIDGPRDGGFYLRADVDAYIAELEAKNKRLVETILSEVEYYQPDGEYMPETEAFYFDGVVYGLEKAAAIVKAALKEKDDEVS